MKAPSCAFCSRVVLEFEGQFGILHPYLLESSQRAGVPVGSCHLACLARSEWAGLWADRQAHHQATVLRHEQIGANAHYRAFHDRRNREWVVVAATGELLGWRIGAERNARRADGGRMIAIEQEYNLELPEHGELIAEVQAALARDKRYPLPQVISRLGLDDVMMHPAALADGAFVLDGSMRRHWSTSAVSARARYMRWIPDEVIALIPQS